MNTTYAIVVWAIIVGTSSALLGVSIGIVILRRIATSKPTRLQYFFGSFLFAIPVCWIVAAAASQYAVQMGGSARLGNSSPAQYTLHAGNIDREVTAETWQRVLFAEFVNDVALFWMVISFAVPSLGVALRQRMAKMPNMRMNRSR